MAIDSRAKRQSVLRVASGYVATVLPHPDGTVDLFDRQMLLDMYGGISAAEPAVRNKPTHRRLRIPRGPVILIFWLLL